MYFFSEEQRGLFEPSLKGEFHSNRKKLNTFE